MSMRGYYPKVALAELTSVDDGGQQQTVSHNGFAGERHTEVYRPQPHGLSSRPPAGSTGVVVSLGGERSRSVFLGGESDAARPTGLNDGETKLYDAGGNVIYCAMKNGLRWTAKQGGSIIETLDGDTKVTTSRGDTTIETPKGKCTITSNGDAYVHSEGKVYLGTMDGAGAQPILTIAGPSEKAFAVLS